MQALSSHACGDPQFRARARSHARRHTHTRAGAGAGAITISRVGAGEQHHPRVPRARARDTTQQRLTAVLPPSATYVRTRSYTCRNDDAYKVIRRREDASSRVVVADADSDQEGSARFSRALTQVLSQGNGRSLIDDTMVALRQIAARGIAGAATLAAVDAYTHYDERGRKATVLEVLGLGDAEVRIFREQKSRWRPVFVSGKMTTIEVRLCGRS